MDAVRLLLWGCCCGAAAVPEPLCREVGWKGAVGGRLLEGGRDLGGKAVDLGRWGCRTALPCCPGAAPASHSGSCFPNWFPFPRSVSISMVSVSWSSSGFPGGFCFPSQFPFC